MRRILAIMLAALCGAGACGGTASTYLKVNDAIGLYKMEGQRVELEGAVAKEIWQHIIGPPPGYRYDTYFDTGKWQIVIYSKEKITCAGRLGISGTVVKVEGSSKDPRRKEAVDEYHVAVDSWECVK